MKTMLAMSVALIGVVSPAVADEAQIERGRYLVTLGGCHDCHTPGYFLGKPDMTQYLGGSDVGLSLPTGVFVGRNLTPDKETGLGTWTKEQIITAFSAGKRPDGRELAPIMPWEAFSHLTDADKDAIASYLQSIPAVKNAVPGPFTPNETPTVMTFVLVPGAVYASMPKPPAVK
jgi:mono/diheme cytochrome c family protein